MKMSNISSREETLASIGQVSIISKRDKERANAGVTVTSTTLTKAGLAKKQLEQYYQNRGGDSYIITPRQHSIDFDNERQIGDENLRKAAAEMTKLSSPKSTMY